MADKPMARPTGVTIISALSIIGGIFAVLGGVALLFGSALVQIAPITDSYGDVISGAFGLFGFIFIMLGFANIAIGVVFYRQRPWAWTVMMILTVLGVIGALAPLNPIGLVIDGVILYYLFTAPIKKIFGATFGPSF